MARTVDLIRPQGGPPGLCPAAGRSVGDLEATGRLFTPGARRELQGVLSTLKSAQDVRTASDAVLLQFERPADQGEAAGPAAPVTGKPTLTDTLRRTPPASCLRRVCGQAPHRGGEFQNPLYHGVLGAPMTPENKARYTKNHAYNTSEAQKARINAASPIHSVLIA